MKYYQSSSKNKRKLPNGVRLILGILFLIIIFFVLYNVFNISNITLKSVDDRGSELVSRYRPDLIYEISKNNIFLFNTDNLIVRKDDHVMKFKIDNIEKMYPSTVFVTISIPESFLTIKMNESCFDVSSDGLILSKSRNSCLINVTDTLSIGDFIDKPTVSIINLLLSDPMITSVSSVDIRDGLMFMTDTDGVSYILPITEDVNVANTKLMLLKKIRQQYTIDSKKLEEMDLRYSKPVVKFR